MHDAVRDGDVARLQELIGAGEDLAAQDKFVGTALHWAALKGDAEAARLLIGAGADVNWQKTGDRQTALHIAAERGSVGVATVLVEADCLAKDRDALLSFYDFPAEHWKHVRTTNPIESTFATVRLRTYRTKGCLSRKTAMAMVFKLCQGASKKWRRLNGSDQFAEIIRGVKFVNGERQDRAAA